jgi:hypothetical protein
VKLRDRNGEQFISLSDGEWEENGQRLFHVFIEVEGREFDDGSTWFYAHEWDQFQKDVEQLKKSRQGRVEIHSSRAAEFRLRIEDLSSTGDLLVNYHLTCRGEFNGRAIEWGIANYFVISGEFVNDNVVL